MEIVSKYQNLTEKGNVVLQKGTFKIIKSWFFPFQGILDFHAPKQKVVLEVLGQIKT